MEEHERKALLCGFIDFSIQKHSETHEVELFNYANRWQPNLRIGIHILFSIYAGLVCVRVCVFCVRFIKRSLHWNVSPFYVGQHDLEIASHSFIYMILYKLAHIQFIRSFVRSFARLFRLLVRELIYRVCIKINWSISHGTIVRSHTHIRKTYTFTHMHLHNAIPCLSLPPSFPLSFHLTFPSNSNRELVWVWLLYIVFMCFLFSFLFAFQRFVLFSREVFFFSAMICCRCCCFRRFICHVFSVRI